MSTDTLPEVGTPDWVAKRTRGIGASELAAACGVSRWKSRFKLWQEKTGVADPVSENSAMKWGTRHERFLIEDYCERNAAELIGTQVTLIVDVGPPEIWATLDALIRMPDGTEAPLECKCTSSRNAELGEDDTDQIPLEWICQAQAQMAAAGAERCYFAVLVDGREEREYVVERDPGLMAGLIRKAAEFWRHVESREVPPAEWADTDERLYRHMWLQDLGEPIDLRGQIAAQIWAEYEQRGRDIKSLEDERERLKAEFTVAIGDHKRALIDDGREVYVLKTDRKGYTVEPKTFFSLRARKAK